MTESPSEVLARKLRGLDLTDAELLLLDHILSRAEAGDGREVEGFAAVAGYWDAGYSVKAQVPINVFDPGRLLRAGGLTDDRHILPQWPSVENG